MNIESRITDLAKWASELPHGGLRRVAKISGIPETTVRNMFDRNCRTKSVDSLIRIEAAKAQIEREGNAA